MQDLLIIGDHTPVESPECSAGMKGLVPRDLEKQKVGYSAVIPPAKIEVASRDEIVRRAMEMERTKSRLSDLYLTGNAGGHVPSLDQNGQGFCWAYGTVGALTLTRIKLKLPYKRLSAHAVACKIKNFRDEGGWGAQALEFIVQNYGCPDVDHWPEKSMSRQYDNAETWANAKLYMPDVSFADLASPVYDRNLSFEQMCTMLVRRNPTSNDYDWWGHCVNACDVVVGAAQRHLTRGVSGKLLDTKDFELVWGMNDAVTQGLGIRIRNSWTDQYGNLGFAVLTGSKAPANNAVAIVSAAA